MSQPNKFGSYKLLLLLLLFSFVKMPAVHAQSPPVFPEKIKNFTTDNLGNIYTLTLDNQVVKYTPDGLEQFRYPNRTLGEASLLDATNPFRLLLFFPEHQTVLMLDRTLAANGQLNLYQLGFQGVRAVGMASDGLLWVYDETNFLLKKIDADGTVMASSGDLSLATGQPLHPVFLVEREQTVFVSDPAVGVLVFDAFGQYRKTIPLPGLTEFQVMDGQLIYSRDRQLWSFHLAALLERPFSLPFELGQASKVHVTNGMLYVLENNNLTGHRI
ncbi:MAG: hypothetical protein IPM82_15130 [Saprospiraceae bacterium]|nr:hypothetical protein [Saprospiraceae bacterium]